MRALYPFDFPCQLKNWLRVQEQVPLCSTKSQPQDCRSLLNLLPEVFSDMHAAFSSSWLLDSQVLSVSMAPLLESLFQQLPWMPSARVRSHSTLQHCHSRENRFHGAKLRTHGSPRRDANNHLTHQDVLDLFTNTCLSRVFRTMSSCFSSQH